MKCPICKEIIEPKTTCQRAGAIVGGLTGAIAGGRAGVKAGLAGAIIGAITGFVTGGTLGYKAGKLVDENYVVKYYCHHCGQESSV